MDSQTNLNSVLIRFTVLVLLSIAPLILTDVFLIDESDFYSWLSSSYTQGQIDDIVQFKSEWGWLTYVAVPVVIGLKLSVVAAILWLGAFLFGLKLTFKQLFIIGMGAQLVYVVKSFVVLGYFGFFSDYSFEDLQHFSPLSMASLFESEFLAPYFLFPLKALSAFELGFMLVLSFLLSRQVGKSFDKGLRIVLSSYGLSFLLWLVSVSFFLVSNT